MNLFSKILVLLLLFCPQTFAITLNGIYTSACEREIGIVVHSDQDKIDFLTIHGELKRLRPYEVIYLAYYPMDEFPFRGAANLGTVKAYQFYTKHRDKIVPYVKGWPTGFTKEKIAVLTEQGQEVLVDRRSIFNLESQRVVNANFTPTSKLSNYKYVHPYSFRKCPADKYLRGKEEIFPQQVLSQPLVIKQEVDRLSEGFERLQYYEREKRFYPVPLVYEDETSLGLWQSFGSRHGASGNRNNNFTPFIRDVHISDIYDFQRIIVTGSSPMPFSLHEEPQTQFQYAFKGSYFHFLGMIDPSLFLVGENYAWKETDFDRAGVRSNPHTILELGLDMGHWSALFYPMYGASTGFNDNVGFLKTDVILTMFGVRYRNHQHSFEFFGGSGARELDRGDNGELETAQTTAFRANYETRPWKQLELLLSFIQKDYSLNQSNHGHISSSTTLSSNLAYPFWKRYKAGGLLSIERESGEFDDGSRLTESYSETHLKLGGFISLSF